MSAYVLAKVSRDSPTEKGELLGEFYVKAKAEREAVKASRHWHSPDILIRLTDTAHNRQRFWRMGRSYRPERLDTFTLGERAHMPQLPFTTEPPSS